jgi:hypothetical protein
MKQQSLIGQGYLIIRALPSHSDTPQSIGLLRMSDKLDRETFTWQLRHWKETDLPAPGGTRTHNPSKPAAGDPRLRPRDLRIGN